uniref:Uncharacterized protein n=1 Tax=viral metagenome TaxID=1070528 RepID=A0A6C0CTR3_9ZZZZ
MDINPVNLFISNIKNFIVDWIPVDLTEIILFTISITMIIIIVMLFHGTEISRKFKNESRCYREREATVSGGKVFTVSAVTNDGIPVYDIIYDFDSRESTFIQKCPDGTAVNKIDVPIYDFTTNNTILGERILQCDKFYNLKTKPIYFKGDPELVRYMMYQSPDFFIRHQSI